MCSSEIKSSSRRMGERVDSPVELVRELSFLNSSLAFVIMFVLIAAGSFYTISACAQTPPITSCQVNISSCPSHPLFSGVVLDNYDNSASDQYICVHQRPLQIFSYCGIPPDGGAVTASFMSDGKIVQSGTVGTLPPPPVLMPPPMPTVTLNNNACADFTVPPPNLSVPSKAVGDEFVGPFASWSNLKKDFGAVGDGLTDDSDAIQSALSALSTATGKSPVLY